ncbi:IS4 family transposase [Lignipirellula cremea]|uniref:Transposase DDE domain protein n=1 Tax=Lignipirellula cremea TaxID=2528010 RepID=A0A518DSI8_9BACT|nr:IS4 family transposase [Lignipirellula cremea]QDU94799.1 Transposase DDE domain protein [Lignipirellula cremea]
MFDSFRSRLAAARRDDQLFFAALIDQQTIRSSFGDASTILDSARIYDTAVTVWVFLSQTLTSGHNCVQAVAKLIAFRAAKGLPIPAALSGAYCMARDKLNEAGMHRLVTDSGAAIEDSVPDQWLWRGHRVIVGDGCTLTMADTPENQEAYPQMAGQKPGCGFPIMRMVVFFGLATGVVLEAAMGRYKGKLTAEVSLFREIDKILEEDDVYLADRAYSGWFDIARQLARGVHVVLRKHQSRRTDFRTGVRYSKDEHAVFWDKPPRPAWMTAEEYAGYDVFLTLREIRVRIATPGFRTREVIIVTNLLDDIEYNKEDLAALYRRRWQAELNLRSLKTVMQMDHLRCKQPHRVRNEIRAHFTAYNLVRQMMCEAAIRGDVQPWQISFKGTMQTLNELLPVLCMTGDADPGL